MEDPRMTEAIKVDRQQRLYISGELVEDQWLVLAYLSDHPDGDTAFRENVLQSGLIPPSLIGIGE